MLRSHYRYSNASNLRNNFGFIRMHQMLHCASRQFVLVAKTPLLVFFPFSFGISGEQMWFELRTSGLIKSASTTELLPWHKMTYS